ncbi:MAG: urease accessory protein UreD [Betaproteobacteria bacterium]
MSWHARLDLDYALEEGRSVARFRHEGPLRILQSLYPQGPAVCHNILVHPPGGLVGGDTLDLRIKVAAQAHGLITTPGATRFYRSTGEQAVQRTQLELAAGARLEWLPLEALCFAGCLGENRLEMRLAPGAELIGWDITALGLPQSGQPFTAGRLLQHIEVPGLWLERAQLDAADDRLMNSPLGLAQRRCLATLFFISGNPIDRQGRENWLEQTRGCLAGHPLITTAGVTSPNDQMVVLRILSPLVEPAVLLMRHVWQAWRRCAWQMDAPPPRIWST